MDGYSGFRTVTLEKLIPTPVRLGSEYDYCSLVEERCLDFIHWISAASA